jgi:hypothetical protein
MEGSGRVSRPSLDLAGAHVAAFGHGIALQDRLGCRQFASCCIRADRMHRRGIGLCSSSSRRRGHRRAPRRPSRVCRRRSGAIEQPIRWRTRWQPALLGQGQGSEECLSSRLPQPYGLGDRCGGGAEFGVGGPTGGYTVRPDGAPELELFNEVATNVFTRG